MENPLEILSDEHQNILKVINAMERECADFDIGKKSSKDFFEKAIDFIINYGDKFHHAKEEEILFAELKKNNAEITSCGVVEQMLYEHNLGRNFIKSIKEGLKENNKDKIVKNAKGYAQLLQEHIYKEDNILYPMVNEALNEQTQKSILEQFKQAEEKFEKEIKDKYIFIAKNI